MRKLFIFLLFFIISFSLYSQRDTVDFYLVAPDDWVKRIEERIIETVEENGESILDETVEEVQHVMDDKKINLNDLSPEVAFSILKLTDFQYYQLQLYIENYNQLLSLYELLAIEGFTKEDLERLTSRVEVRPKPEKSSFFKNFFKYARHQLLLRYGQIVESRAGYDKTQHTYYTGSPFHLAFKYRFTTQDRFSISFSGEKDAGEQFFKGGQKQGFDFYSMHLCLKSFGLLKTFVIGDYKLNMGQGLVMGSQLLSGKGGGVGAVRRFPTSIQPVSPLNESNFLRGIAVHMGNYRFSGTLFYAHRFFDGSLQTNEEGQNLFEGSLSVSGYHRTLKEISQKEALRNRIYGVDFVYRHRIFKIGIRAVRNVFSAYLNKTEAPYKQYDFSGMGNCNIAFDYQVLIKKHLLFGEFALDQKGAPALLQGAIFELHPKVKIATLFRYYDKSYIALQGGAFGVNRYNQNETGLYVTLQCVLNRKLELNYYHDIYYFPWLKYQIDAPSTGSDLGISLDYRIHQKCNLTFRYQLKKREQNFRNDYTNTLYTLNRNKFRMVMTYHPLEWVQLKTEFDFMYNQSHAVRYYQHGLLLFQDLNLSINKVNLMFKLRFALFDTDSYEERIYAYEQDLYCTFTVNGYYDKGCRIYLMLKYSYKFLDIWIRVAQTYYSNKTEIGSGLDAIKGKTKTEVKAQVVMKL